MDKASKLVKHVLELRAVAEAANDAKKQADADLKEAEKILNDYALSNPEDFEPKLIVDGMRATIREGGARAPERLRGVTENRLKQRFIKDRRTDLLKVDNSKLKGLPADELRSYSLKPQKALPYVHIKPAKNDAD